MVSKAVHRLATPRADRRLALLGTHLRLDAAPPAAFRRQQHAAGSALPPPPSFILIAHRGGQEILPENTLPAFLCAIERLGPDPVIEFDVQLTSDGVPVVIHDDTVDRTAAGVSLATKAPGAGSTAVAAMTLAELQKLELTAEGNSWEMGEGNPATGRVPTLDQLLQAVAGRCHLLLELKSEQPGLVSAVAASLERWGWLDEQSTPYAKGGVTVFCQVLGQLREVGELAPHAARMLAVPQIDAAAVELAQTHHLEGLSTSSAHEDLAEQVALAKSAGLRCRTAGIGAPDDDGLTNLRRAVEAGADGTTIDWPFKAKDVVQMMEIMATAAQATAGVSSSAAAGVSTASPGSEFPDGDPSPGPPTAGTITIYGQPTSRVCKVMWVCAELGVPFEQHSGFAFRNDDWALALNPKGTVPFIRDGDLVLNESNTIVAHLANRYSAASGIYPVDVDELSQAWQWLEFGEQFLVPRTNPVFFGVVRESYAPSLGRPGAPSAEEIEAAVPKCAEAFHALNAHLAGKQMMLGDVFTMADITVAIQANRLVGNDGFGFAELSPTLFPNVVAWHARLSERPAFAEHVLPRFT